MFDKLRLTPAGWETDSRERKSYYIYFAGQNMIYSLVSTYLVTYLMFQGVDLAKAGTIMLLVKIWDAINDAIFGVIFDSVKFRSGKKYLPWLKISNFLIPLSTIILFLIPKSSGETLKLAWFAVAYICWDTAYTLCDVPIYGVITSMTKNMDERNSMLSYKSIWGGVGTAVTTLIASVLVSEKIGSNYSVVAIITSVGALSTMLPVVFNIKERYNSVDEETFTIRRMLKYLIRNKYLLIYLWAFTVLLCLCLHLTVLNTENSLQVLRLTASHLQSRPLWLNLRQQFQALWVCFSSDSNTPVGCLLKLRTLKNCLLQV